MSTSSLFGGRTRAQILAFASQQKHRVLSSEQAAAMDAVFPAWRQTFSGIWYSRLESVESFHASNGFFPRTSANESDEKKLGSWIATQRYRAASLPADRIVLLDQRLPGWRKTNNEIWHERLAEVRALVVKNGRFPTLAAAADADEYAAYSWIKGNKRLPSGDPRRVILDEEFPYWNESLDARWERNLIIAKEYYDVHGRIPPQTEKSCGSWISVQKHRATPEHRARINAAIPGWDKSPEDKWEDALSFTVAFLSTHGRLPSYGGKEPGESFHYQWLSGQRKAKNTMPSSRKLQLDESIPRWTLNGLDAAGETWHIKFAACKAFFVERGRFPSLSRKSTVDEKVLSTWLHNQIKTRVAGRHDLLDHELPGWRGRSSR